MQVFDGLVDNFYFQIHFRWCDELRDLV
jgi:hypothetical protein